MSNDTIYRQAAINAIERESQVDGTYGYMDTKSIIDVLEDLPSAQPDNRLEKIADIVEGTIDHLDRDDAMDMLYQIKEVLK